MRTTIQDEMSCEYSEYSEYLRQKKPEKEEQPEDEPSWKNRPLHSIYCWQTKEIDIENAPEIVQCITADANR